MEDLEANLIQTRKSCRIEQMVAKWLHRSRDSTPRGSVSAMESSGDSGVPAASRAKLTVTVYKDLVLQHYGFEICPSLPLTIASVAAGSTAEGKLQPGDQLLLINSKAVDDVSVERAASIIRDAGDELLLTVLRCTSGGPKSSFLTEEKRARLKTNPVKVRFAEEVLLNGHSQGNSLLCMPNVLKVYLENGQTKAFRFERSTTVKDIVLTLQEKLSIRSIAHFALVLEEQYNLAKIHLLHEEELIAQVVQKRESHDYRCLFRVCFVPKDPLDLLQEDPVAFEYLYLQSCSDVLHERFAVEMKCSVALRLAALHIQERIYACAQPQKVSLKYIERDWGIENFISPTLLRNMRGKDIKKAISYHLKRNQVLLDPRQKHTLTATQVRLNYLQILGELKTYSGKIFNATMMLQDRESYVALLVGAKHGVSQIINSKLNIVTSLAEFPSISRVELSEESERVSTVKIYLQDLKVLTLLLEANTAKDLICLIVGYYRLFVDANASIFTWGDKTQQLHRVSAEEGYESRGCSDSEDSWEPECSPGRRGETPSTAGSEGGRGEPRSPGRDGGDNATDSPSEGSDSANSESRGFKTSGSSDSMDALEEDELAACSAPRPELFRCHSPTVREMSGLDGGCAAGSPDGAGAAPSLCLVPCGQGAATALQDRLDTTGYYSLCCGTAPAGTARHGGIAQHGLPVLQPPPGFGDSSSEEEFYDAADRLSPPDTLAGKPIPAGHLPPTRENFSCIPRRPRCYSLGETYSMGQTAREKHRGEKELTYAKSLRKRRSFLKTDYTSQVSFPSALQDSPQSCCSWLPTRPSLEDMGKDVDTGLPLAPLAQRDTAGTDPRCDPMEMEPDAMETKSVMEWVASSISAVRRSGDQCGEENSSLLLAQSPLLSVGEAEPPPGAQSGAAPESSPLETDPEGLSEGSRVPTGDGLAGGAREEGGEATPPQHKAGTVPPSWGQEGTCPAGQLVLPPPAPGPSTALAPEVAEEQELLAGPCREGKAGVGCCAGGSGEGPVSRVRGRQVVSGGALRKVHEGHVGFPEAAQLLGDCGAAGVLTRLSWLSFGVRTELAALSLAQDGAGVPLEPLGSRRTREHRGAGAVGGAMPAPPAAAGLGQQLGSSAGAGEGQPGAPTGNVAQRQPQPAQASRPRERAAQGDRDSCLAPAPGLPSPSGPVPLDSPGKGPGGHGAGTHSFLCFKHEEGEQGPSQAPPARGSLSPHGPDSCGCRLPYIGCFRQPDRGEHETSPPACPGPLTTPPSCSLPTSGFPVPAAGDGAGRDPHVQALGQLKDQAWLSPADFSRFLAYTAELQEVVGKLSGNQASHLQDQCTEQGADSKGALGWASRDLLSSCQELLSTEQPLTELQQALRATFDRLVQLAVACFQVTHCWRCRQRQQELGAALGDVVGTYQGLVQAVHQQLHGQGCPELGAKLLARQHMALSAAVFCLLQQFRAPP
ncbi:FRPD1 protein, partial [Scytalopus superciliaris]|nr:FRPD1 protein [Scytalopus superciliaris]